MLPADSISMALWFLLPPLARLQVVIFLYLLDNDTSFVILASTFVGILIEFWKVRLRFCVQTTFALCHASHEVRFSFYTAAQTGQCLRSARSSPVVAGSPKQTLVPNGCALSAEQITKAMDVTLDRSGPLPRLRFKNRESYQKSRTQEYDAQAMRYLSYVLYPLVSAQQLHAWAGTPP